MEDNNSPSPILKIDEEALNRVDTACLKRTLTARTPRDPLGLETPSRPNRSATVIGINPSFEAHGFGSFDPPQADDKELITEALEPDLPEESVERKREIFRLLNTTLDTLYMPMGPPGEALKDVPHGSTTTNASPYSQDIPPGMSLISWFNEKLVMERNIQISAIEEFLNNAQKAFARKVCSSVSFLANTIRLRSSKEIVTRNLPNSNDYNNFNSNNSNNPTLPTACITIPDTN